MRGWLNTIKQSRNDYYFTNTVLYTMYKYNTIRDQVWGEDVVFGLTWHKDQKYTDDV